VRPGKKHSPQDFSPIRALMGPPFQQPDLWTIDAILFLLSRGRIQSARWEQPDLLARFRSQPAAGDLFVIGSGHALDSIKQAAES